MFLSRVELNEYRRDTMKAMASPQIMHAAVMASFQAFDCVDDGRILWRTDRLGNVIYLIVQSPKKPDFTHIIEQFGRPATDQSWDTVEYDPHLNRMVNGSRWAFRLRANPTYSVMEDGKTRGKVCHHITAEQQLKWLFEKASKCGFRLESEDGTLGADVVQREVKKFRRGEMTVTLSVVTFEGVLEVTDSNLFIDSMKNGIGRAKAYGCGLLTTRGV